MSGIPTYDTDKFILYILFSKHLHQLQGGIISQRGISGFANQR